MYYGNQLKNNKNKLGFLINELLQLKSNFMKKYWLFLSLVACTGLFAQDHYSGINTSPRIGILNGSMNPAEFSSMVNATEVHVFSISAMETNNKISFNDLSDDTDFEELLFAGDEPINLRFDFQALGPSVAFGIKKWGFAFMTRTYGKLNLVDIDPTLGYAITGEDPTSSLITAGDNQRINGTAYGEVAFAASRTFWETDTYKFNGGATFKLLFPGSYANLGLDNFEGTVNTVGGETYLSNTTANVNIAYSGNLTNGFQELENYYDSVFGSLNGYGVDLGVTFMIKDADKGYRLNTGISLRNIGEMTFKDDNNSSINYTLTIPQATVQNPGLNVEVFNDVESIAEVEQILLDSGYLTAVSEKNEFNVKLPTVLNVYADLKIISKFYASLFIQQKLGDDQDNDQITAQNIITVTPRFSLKHFEVFTPLTQNEISGFNAGLGFRAGGFFMGSGSVFNAVFGDSKEADLYIGFRFGIGKS